MRSPATHLCTCLLLMLLVCPVAGAQVNWETRYHGNLGNDELIDFVAELSQGQLMLLESEGLNGNDVRVASYNGNASPFWSFTHDSGGNDRPRAAVYSAGGCTVLHDIYNGTDWDVRVTGFSSAGTVNWSDTYSSAADDEGATLAWNSLNDLFVVTALHNGTDYDWLVVRYNNSGTAQSAQVLDWGADDLPTAIATDNAGAVYIVGTSDDGASGGVNVRVAKMSSAGSMVWSVPYDGGFGTDAAVGITCDGSGNCYVVGTAETASGEDILLLRVTATGIVDWNQRFNGGTNGSNLPGGVRILSTGGCVVSGSVFNGTNYDWFTAGYDTAGTQDWRDDFVSAQDDLGSDLSVDGVDGTASVGISGTGTATTLWTLYFDNTGARVWTDSTSGENLAAAKTGFRNNGEPSSAATTFHVSNTDGLIRHLDTGGALNSEGRQPLARDVVPVASAVDASGNIFVVGEHEQGDRPILVKYDSSGIQQWARLYQSNTAGIWKSIAITSAGNICVTGEVFGTSNWMAVTAQYTSAGALDWTATHANPFGRGVDLEVDASGNVYTLIWGRTPASGASDDVLVHSYDSGGTPGWTYRYDSGDEDHPTDMTMDATGNLYITGDVDSGGSATGLINFLAIKLDSSGNEQWVRTPNYPSQDYGHRIAVDTAGNVYVAGLGGNPYGIATVSWTSNGTFRWDATDTPFNNNANVDMIVNGNGEICVVSTQAVTGNGDDIVLLRYDAAGGLQGKTQHDVAGQDDTAARIAADSQNRLYVAGGATVPGNSEDSYIARFSASGAFEWGINYDGAGFPDNARCLNMTSSDRPIVVARMDLNPRKPWSVRQFDPGASPTDILLSSASVDENSTTGTVVGTLSTVDPSPGDTHTYSLVSGTGSTHNGEFSIVNDELRVATSPDYEAGNTRSIRIRTTDSTSLFYEEVLIITINDLNEAPTAIQLTPSNVNEAQPPNEIVGAFNTTDPDVADVHTYSLVTGTGDADNSLFTISGQNLRTLATLDFETASTLSIRVRSQDSGSLSIEQVFVIQVNDLNEAPTQVTLSQTSVPEMQAINTLVGNLGAVDPDSGDSHTFSLVSGTGDSGNASFSVNGNQLLTAAVFDSSVQASYSIRVRATDVGSLQFEQVFTITITTFDAPTDIQLSPSAIDENLPPGTTVGTLTAIDPSVGDSHTFSLVAGPGDTDNSLFAVFGDQLQSAASFDFEARNSFSIRTRATDSTMLTYDKVFIITVNDIAENSGGGGGDKEEDKGCPATTSSDATRLLTLLLLGLLIVSLRRITHQGDHRH